MHLGGAMIYFLIQTIRIGSAKKDNPASSKINRFILTCGIASNLLKLYEKRLYENDGINPTGLEKDMLVV
jgi:hypothetical protein